MKVPFFDYTQIYKQEYPIYSDALADVLRRSDFILRGDLEEFEKELGAFVGARHAIGVGNGTDAIWLGLLAMGVKPGDEVILPSHTYVATADAVMAVGAVPVLVDVEKIDHLISINSIESSISSKTTAIIPVNLNGRTAELDKISALADKHKLKVVEDNAQGLGAKLNGKHSGTFGNCGTFSFFPAKILGGLGDGGALSTNDSEVDKTLRLLRNHGRSPENEVVSWGYNSRLDNLQAAILSAKLKVLDANISRRRDIAMQYWDGLNEIKDLDLPPDPRSPRELNRFDSFQNYELLAEGRRELREYLDSVGIGSTLPWGGKAVHQFNLPGVKTSDLSTTEEIFKKVMLLPMNQYMENAHVDTVIEKVRAFYGK